MDGLGFTILLSWHDILEQARLRIITDKTSLVEKRLKCLRVLY